ncbi:hypothetical protein CC1G_15315 [Coprinopsis cinerea okayama7|uniref:Uncharacterized protein n=1 Tax=Coprinopsis cinerea (strain Okayama-7 / 130 / ATCC MYA-4618 / FGSC 9003) TaxID=240176 RepID=D6RPZ4_COPC7|nr:hypothetical protein CC1G_15315 [Coprinopsis cinerea okayama7\|eukprot:XP_002910408.1 hypothetical protein CC1G_15315 [Coprinopsis cinerea okayama7\
MTIRTPDTPGQVITRGREMTLGNDQRTWSDSWKLERPTGRKLVGNDQGRPYLKDLWKWHGHPSTSGKDNRRGSRGPTPPTPLHTLTPWCGTIRGYETPHLDCGDTTTLCGHNPWPSTADNTFQRRPTIFISW